MHGKGIFYWRDSSQYVGDFKDGYPSGVGTMILPDLSKYDGEVCEGYFHGKGVYNIVSTPVFYSGSWKSGKRHGKLKESHLYILLHKAINLYTHVFDRNVINSTKFYNLGQYLETFLITANVLESIFVSVKILKLCLPLKKIFKIFRLLFIFSGKGWIEYEPNNWYDGEWCEDYKEGYGTRQYEKGTVFKGNWVKNKKNGVATQIWSNHDVRTSLTLNSAIDR